jgi:cell division protein FtsW (lipid II flippase)
VAKALGISWANPGWIAVGAAGVLTLLGVAAIGTTQPSMAARQGIYAIVGLVLGAAVVVPHPMLVERWAVRTFFCWLALLVLLVAPGVPESVVRARNGSRCWIDLGPLDVQPAEFAKIAWILASAWWLTRAADLRTGMGIGLPLVLTAVPVLLILVQPDLGTALLFFPTLLAMLLAQGASRKRLALVIVTASLLAPATYPFLRPHQRARIDSLVAQVIGDERYTRTIGFQGDRARTLVGAGGVFGNGADQARALVRFNALPEEHNDMIFAVVACRWGLVGGLLVIGMEAALAVGAFWIAATTKMAFGRMVGVGVGAMLGFQSCVNIGMTMGILPITGLTLPFVSSGGSSIVACWIAVGLLFSIAARDARATGLGGGSARRALA